MLLDCGYLCEELKYWDFLHVVECLVSVTLCDSLHSLWIQPSAVLQMAPLKDESGKQIQQKDQNQWWNCLTNKYCLCRHSLTQCLTTQKLLKAHQLASLLFSGIFSFFDYKQEINCCRTVDTFGPLMALSNLSKNIEYFDLLFYMRLIFLKYFLSIVHHDAVWHRFYNFAL